MHLSLPERIVKHTFNFTVHLISRHANKACVVQLQELENLSDETVGKAIANSLKEHGYALIPGFESHDMKHVLLDYPMTPLGEVRLQAFMIGNGNRSLTSLAIFLFGFAFLPNAWEQYLHDFQCGLEAVPIKSWSIEQLKHQNLQQMKNTIFQETLAHRPAHFVSNLKAFSMLGSYAVIAAGIFGMLFCFPFLWSSNLADLIGAGFPFVAGAILVIGGFLNLSILAAKS